MIMLKPLLAFWQKLKDDRHTIELIGILVSTTLVLSVIMTSLVIQSIMVEHFQKGDVAAHTVRSHVDFKVEDTNSTERERKEKERAVKRVFVYEDAAPDLTVSAIIGEIERFLASYHQPTDDVIHLSSDDRKAFERQFGVDLNDSEWAVLLDADNAPEIKDAVLLIAEPVSQKGVIYNKDSLRVALNSHGVILRKRSTNEEQTVYSAASLYDISEAKRVVQRNVIAAEFGRGAAFASLVTKLSTAVIKPNVFFDSVETERRIKEAQTSVPPQFHVVRRGQVIVRAGDQISDIQELKIRKLYNFQDDRDTFRVVIGYFLLINIIIVSVYSFTIRVWPTFNPRNRDLTLIGWVLIGSVALMRAFSLLGDSVSLHLSDVDAGIFALMTPLAAGGILLEVTLGPAAVFLFLMTLSLLTGVFLEDSWMFLLHVIIGNIVGAVSVKHCSRRATFLRAGLNIAMVNALIVACFFILYPQFSSTHVLWKMFFGMVGGIMSGLVAAGLAPLVEYFGAYITDIKLLELASLDRPLLRELALQAPGTWNHSVIMGQLGEAAAESVGANPILTRVGAYYHDIGKLKKPAYFIENQGGGENRHDKLTPSMSALIIKAHVKDGIEMARKVNLPDRLINLIPQHHGTAIIEYFFEKAKKEAEEGEIVDESHYRYGGPKPQTKEAGIIMLCDCVEAASRTLSDPTPARIQGMVQKIINKIFINGQLEESDLTLNDLHHIAKQFTRVLTGILHRRIEYAEPAEKTNTSRQKEGEHQHHETESDPKHTNTSGKKEKSTSGSIGETDGQKVSGEVVPKKQGEGLSQDALRRLGM